MIDQSEVKRWVEHNFGNRDRVYAAAKVAEEVGELVGATLKERQGIRTHENQCLKAYDAVGDVAIALISYCALRGWDFEHVVEGVWSSVRKRDWRADPERQHIEHP